MFLWISVYHKLVREICNVEICTQNCHLRYTETVHYVVTKCFLQEETACIRK